MDLLFKDISPASIIFLLLAVFIVATLVIWQFSPDKFDLREAITSRGKDGQQHIDLHKVLLIGSWLIGSYVLIKDSADGSANEWLFGLYLTAFVSARIATLVAQVKGGGGHAEAAK